MTKYTFEEYLMEKHVEKNPHFNKDILVDDFNDWLVRIDVDDILDYAQEYADKEVAKIQKP